METRDKDRGRLTFSTSGTKIDSNIIFKDIFESFSLGMEYAAKSEKAINEYRIEIKKEQDNG